MLSTQRLTRAYMRTRTVTSFFAQLFGPADDGFIYDPSNLNTMFQDAAGTTPVASDGDPVGLRLDVKHGLGKGPEVLTNGDFDTDSDWVKETGWTISGGIATQSGAGSGITAQLYQADVFDELDSYEVTYTITTSNDGNLFIRVGTTNRFTVDSSVGTHTVIAQASGIGNFYFEPEGFAGDITSVSAKKLFGRHAYQKTSASRLTYRTDGNLHWVEYDGIDDYMTLGDVMQFGTDDITAAFGIHSTDTGTYRGELLSKRGSGGVSDTGWGFRDDNGQLKLEYVGTLRQYVVSIGDAGTLQSRSVHIAEVDRDVAGRSYLNNVLASATFNTSGTGDVSGTRELGIGRQPDSSDYFEGDEYGMVCVNRLLTTAERTNLNRYLSTKAGL